ncbi:phage tail protein, partial [Haemophilus influenzae]
DINQQFLQAQKNLSQIGTLKKVWEGSVSTGSITISESCYGKTLIFTLHVSGTSNYQGSDETVSFEVGAQDASGLLSSVREVIVYQNYRQVVTKKFSAYVTEDGRKITISENEERTVKRIDIR